MKYNEVQTDMKKTRRALLEIFSEMRTGEFFFFGSDDYYAKMNIRIKYKRNSKNERIVSGYQRKPDRIEKLLQDKILKDSGVKIGYQIMLNGSVAIFKRSGDVIASFA